MISIPAAQRIKHYGIAAYGTVCAMAEVLGRSEDLEIRKETLEEEKQTDEKLTELSESINTAANDESASEGSNTGKMPPRTPKERAAA